MKLRIGDKEFTVKVADEDATREKGLKGVDNIPKSHGLALVYENEQIIPITMQDMKIPIDVIYSRGGKVQRVHSLEVGSEDYSHGEPSDIVIEINKGEGSGVKKGNSVEWVGSKGDDDLITMAPGGVTPKPGEMHVLDEDGRNQMNVKGDERIYSRVHTRRLVKLAQDADKSKSDSDYKKLGRAMVGMIYKQDTQEQEFVDD